MERAFGRGMRFQARKGRRFEKGDLRYVILDVLRDQPRHGYDIIRAIGERFGGMYAPSPGTVYPTLQMLEDQGFVTPTQHDGKRVYTITEEGRKFLEERREHVDNIWSRGGTAEANGEELRELFDTLGSVFGMLRRSARRIWDEPSKLSRIREVVQRAQREIEAIVEEPAPPR
jgi:DNA-binding PadR family transcriptional regulator